MKTAARGRAATLASLGLSLALAACGSGNDNGGGGSARSVDVALTDEGCDPAKLNRPAGPVTFKVTNKGTDKVTEFEVTDGDRILGEVENVTAGLERSFSLNLTAGSYTMKCPGGSGASQGTLTVSGDRAAGAGADADLVTAAERYQGYVEGFEAADESLAPYRSGTGYVPYNQLTDADTRKLAQSIDALAEPLSQVGGKLAGS